MQDLPIYEVLPRIKQTLSEKNTLILEAPPGAGKSTVVPISLLDEPWLDDKIIIMLEPRRVAARMVASQMARLLGEKVGQRVGYQIKMESCVSDKTKILVVTEAILVRMLQSDQSLENVAMVIFDEFHERSIHTDLSLALSLQVQELLRDDLKLLIMSATLNSDELVQMLGKNTPVITSKGRVFEIENIYLSKRLKQPDFRTINKYLTDIVLNAYKNDGGDILVFLSGAKEISNLLGELKKYIKDKDVLILPLYSALSKKEQDLAILPNEKRKIILSTNIAQTSLTIEGVRVVVDSGMEKLSMYNYANGMDHLESSFISADSATQRAGRAGRVANGKCYKLWHEDKILAKTTKAEILRSDLSSLLLNLALWGVDEFTELQWLDIPFENVIEDTRETLKELHMLDTNNKITNFGKDAIALGIHPRYAFMILKAYELVYSYEACLLCSLLTSRDIFKSSHKSDDIKERFTHLFNNDIEKHFINKHTAIEVYKQCDFFYNKLKKIKKVESKNTTLNTDMLSVLLLFAYPDRLAKLRKKDDLRYKLSNGKGATLNNKDNTLYNEQYLVVANLNAYHKDSYINLALAINLELIKEYFSDQFKEVKTINYQKNKQKFEKKEATCFLQLELFSKITNDISKEEHQELLIEQLKADKLSTLSWNKKAKNLQNKINFINHHCPDLDFIDYSDEWLCENIELWLAPYLDDMKSIGSLKNLDLFNILVTQIPWEQKKTLDTLLPKTYTVPSGSNIEIDYEDINKPKISVKIQELFGLFETPKILNGKLPLQIQLLSPAMRPIQITEDLKSFWDNSYEEVRKELRGKYQKHYWPENPYDAVATKKTKKYMD
jgi:ATP-dependent helicase HrpB